MSLAINAIFKKENLDKEIVKISWSDLILKYIENKLETIYLVGSFLIMPILITFLITALYLNKATILLIFTSPLIGLGLCYWGPMGFGKYNFFNNRKIQYEKIKTDCREIKNQLSTVLMEKENQAEIIDVMNFFINHKLLPKNSSQENIKRTRLNFLVNLEEKNYEEAVKYLLDFFVCFSRVTIRGTLYEKSLMTLPKAQEVLGKPKSKKEKYLEML